MTAVLVGIIFIVVGILGMLHWTRELLYILQGILPISLLVGGVIAVVAGIADFRSRRDSSSKE